MSKITFNVHNKMSYGRDYSADEKRKLYQDVDKLNPDYVLVMDWPDFALDQKKNGRKVIYRHSHERDGDLHNVFSYNEYYSRFVAPYGQLGYIVQLHNEPKIISWHFTNAITDLAGLDKFPLLLPNFGTGDPNENFLDLYAPLWNIFDKWKGLHYLGIHEYGSSKGFNYNVGSDQDVTPWHIGRTNTFIIPYLLSKFHTIPNIIISEFGIDDIYPGKGNKRFWRDVYSHEDSYVSGLINCVKSNYLEDYYKAICLSFYGNTGRQGTSQDWDRTDVSLMTSGIDILAGFNRSMDSVKPPVNTPVETPIVVPDQHDYIKMTTVISNNREYKADVGISNEGKLVISPHY